MDTNQEHLIDTSWYDAIAVEVRAKRAPGDEGAVWVLFLDQQRSVHVAMAIEPDGELGPLEYDGLAGVIDGVDPPAVVIAVPRDDGEPLAEDWRLWEEMRARLAVTRCELVDVMVVGRSSWWAVGGEGPDRAA